MSYWLLLPALFGVLSMFMIYSYIHNHQMEILNPSTTIQVSWHKGLGDRVFILLPGMMKRADEQFKPLFNTIRKYGSIDARAYVGHGFNIDQLARSVAQLADSHVRNGKKVTIVGASIGGLVANRALRYLIDANPLLLEIIMVDTPLGIKSLKNYPNWLVFLTRIFPSAPVPNFVGNLMINKTKVGIETFTLSDKKTKYHGKSKALTSGELNYLNIHNFSTWWKQLVVIINFEPTRLKNYITMYVVCQSDFNHVVHQPFASGLWKNQIRSIILYQMPMTAHCSFDEQTTRWESAFDSMLKN